MRDPGAERGGDGDDQGGLAARRVVIRWAWRLFRREWRQQLLVVALLATATAAAVGVAAAAFNLTPARDEAELGSARGLLLAEDVSPSTIDALVSDAEAPAFWILADAEGNEACICTWQGRDPQAKA